MAIRVRCKNCGSKIEAKDELLGQIRNCPKCKSQILIEPEQNIGRNSKETTNAATPSVATTSAEIISQKEVSDHITQEQIVEAKILYENMDHQPSHEPPKKLVPHYRYFIFAHDRMIAHWEIGKGWLYNIGTGFVSAIYNKELLPNSGSFKFVEMMIDPTETGKRLTGLRTFSITGKWAIQAIGRESDEIVSKIDGKAILMKQQRIQLLAFIRNNYMPEFLNNCKEVYDYLICDYTPESDVFVSDSQIP